MADERTSDRDRIEPLFSALPEREAPKGLSLGVRIAITALCLGALLWLVWHQSF